MDFLSSSWKLIVFDQSPIKRSNVLNLSFKRERRIEFFCNSIDSDNCPLRFSCTPRQEERKELIASLDSLSL